MPNRVDGAVHTMQSTDLHPPANRALINADRAQLSSCDEAVLAAGDRRNSLLDVNLSHSEIKSSNAAISPPTRVSPWSRGPMTNSSPRCVQAMRRRLRSSLMS